MAGTESISSLNSLFFLDYSYLNALLKKRGRTREENANFVTLFRSELVRVNSSFEYNLQLLQETREQDANDRELLISSWQKCVHLEEFASSNKKAAMRVKEMSRSLLFFHVISLLKGSGSF
jgi:hypothetical protein